MKRIFLFLIALFLLISQTSFSQNEKMLLRPENGKEYIYEFNDHTYLQNEKGEKLREFSKFRQLHIKFASKMPDNKEYLEVRLIKGNMEKSMGSRIEYRDLFYPEYKNGFYNLHFSDSEELICKETFRYKFDYETSEIKLVNKDEVLLGVRKNLEEKGFEKKAIDESILIVMKGGIPKITELLNSIYQISLDQFSGDNLKKSEYKITFDFPKPISKFSLKRWEKKHGLYSRELVANAEEKYLVSHNTVEIDTLSGNSFWSRGNQSYNEKEIKLVRIKNIQQNRFTISGNVEHLKHKKVSLAVLRDPFGTKMDIESVVLDENNSFHIETELNNPCFVFLRFGQENRGVELPVLTFYAEPGSEIHLEAKGESFPWSIKFSGDSSASARMLYNFQKEFKLFKVIDFRFSSWYLSRLKFEYSDFEKVLRNFDSYLGEYNNEMDGRASDYIYKEVNALLKNGAIQYLNNVDLSNEQYFGRFYFPEKDQIDVVELEQFLNSHPVHKTYNDYGLLSRLYAHAYFSYHFNKTIKISGMGFPEFTLTRGISGPILYSSDLPQTVEVAKTLLAGHALYAVLANHLNREKISVSNTESKNHLIVQKQVGEYFHLMQILCNNLEFSDAIKKIQDNHSNWLREDFIPSTKFFNPKGNPVYLKDFMGEKPTVFFITSDWGKERYSWDDLAKENKEINFVLVMEGSSFQEWQEYIERAEPVAHQLFLVNNNVQLGDIFKNSYSHFIVYDKNGIRVACANNPEDGRNYAKQSLITPKKKELDKSQLLTIVIVLSFILTILVIGLLVWKWRVRQRFRKEEQFRKLKELELTSIRSQMNPHFLFNSLNSVQNLVQQNKGREAHLYLSDFAGLIRKVLRNSEKEEVSLAEELEMTEQYLNLEKLRFEFDFTISVDDKIDLHNTMVPSMLLQPIVENAVTHGLQNKLGKRKLGIDIILQEQGIQINIEDNGIGREAAQKIEHVKNGKGSKLVQERLKILQEKQGEKYSIKTVDLENENGTRVEIIIPEEK